MRLCLFFILASVALLGDVSSRQVAFVSPSQINQLRPAQLIAPAASSNNVGQCFGLARRTRTRSVQVPILYNRISGQSATVPDYLFSLNDRTIDRMESEGWEVIMKSVMMPETFYQRVPICCRWNTPCFHGQKRMQVPITSPAASRMSPCTNGGVLVVRGGVQTCSCPSGFRGAWCELLDLIQGSFPRGPVIPYNARQDRRITSGSDMLKQAVRQAQMWKEKMISSRQPSVVFGTPRGAGQGPLLSPNDHFLQSVAKPWSQPTLQRTPNADQTMKMRMAMMMNELYRKQSYGRRNQMMNPMMRQKAMTSNPSNPYSLSSSQAVVNPQMLSMLNHLQGRNGVAFGQSMVPTQAYNGAYNTRRNQGPQARTPWDMDPWDRQRGGSQRALMGGPSNDKRDRLMALAFAQYLQKIQSHLANSPANGRGGMMTPNMAPSINSPYPLRGGSRPMNPMSSGIVKSPIREPMEDSAMPPFAHATTGKPSQFTDDKMTSVEMPMPGLGNGAPSLSINSQPGIGALTTDQQQLMLQGVGPINGQQMLQGMPMGGGGGGGTAVRGGAMPKMPSQEELEKMTECRVVLEPRITMCLKDAGHDVSLEHFMNPEYIETAREVCADGVPVGQCVMRQDQACGDGDDKLEMTRKMIDSVLQMMGMVCGQIMRIDQQQGRQFPQSPVTSHQNPLPVNQMPPQGNIGTPAAAVAGALPGTTFPTEEVTTETIPSSTHSAPSKLSDKFTTTKIGAAVTAKSLSKVASKSDKGHHSVEPVHNGIFILGYPLWLVFTISGVLLLLILVSIMALCLAVRRRRRQKEAHLNKEFERMPQPLDSKLYTIGIPPPNYTTATIKTQDDLSLPPLDLADDSDAGSVSAKEESDGGEDEEKDMKKTPLSDVDADDESDEKDEEMEKKKKEKKDKK